MKNLLRKLVLLAVSPIFVITALVWAVFERIFNARSFSDSYSISDDVWYDMWEGL